MSEVGWRSELDEETQRRVDALLEDGLGEWERFDADVRSHGFHPFMPAQYERVLDRLLELRAPGQRFLEWGSATGVITVMADMIGFEAYGIELDPALVKTARELAARHGSAARFAAGSFLPEGYVWQASDGDRRMGTIGEGPSGYEELGRKLSDFDVVFGYPWSGEDLIMRDLMARHGAPGARLVVWGSEE